MSLSSLNSNDITAKEKPSPSRKNGLSKAFLTRNGYSQKSTSEFELVSQGLELLKEEDRQPAIRLRPLLLQGDIYISISEHSFA
jgi:hypothetical protein